MSYIFMVLSYNLGYQESMSVHPTRRQIFAGKLDSTFPNIWQWLIFYFHLHLGSNLFLVNVKNVQKYIHKCTVFLAFASRGVLMKHPISLRAIIPCNHSPQTPLNCDPSFEIVNLAPKRTYCHFKQIKDNILIIIKPVREARGPEGPARWER